MNILYVATSFPAPEKGSSIYTDLAEALSVNNKVTVLVTEEKKNTNITSWKSERNCDVLRVKVGNIYDVSLIEKGISILVMEHLVKKAIKRYLIEKSFDLILYESPPVTNCGIVKYAKNLFNAKAYLMLKDIFPQNAVDIGIIKKNSLIYKIFRTKEKKLYEVSDFIGTMSKGNREYLLEKNKFLSEKKVGIFPNTKKITKKKEIIKNNRIREEYDIPKDSVLFLFGGNMGKPQGVEFLCKCINDLKNEKGIFFILVGRGTQREYIKNYIREKECKNVIQIDNLHRDEYEKLLLECDVGLVLLDSRFTIPNYPSRILSYMEYSKPVLVATDKNTDFKELTKEAKCGLWSYSGDSNKFCNNAIILAKDEKLRREMGNKGREYMELNFSVEKSVSLIENFMKGMK